MGRGLEAGRFQEGQRAVWLECRGKGGPEGDQKGGAHSGPGGHQGAMSGQLGMWVGRRMALAAGKVAESLLEK